MDTITVKKALDTLGVALASHNHTWTDEERELYERAIACLDLQENGRPFCNACGWPITDEQKNVGYECDLHEECAKE